LFLNVKLFNIFGSEKSPHKERSARDESQGNTYWTKQKSFCKIRFSEAKTVIDPLATRDDNLLRSAVMP
jgi:hypothetical protein